MVCGQRIQGTLLWVVDLVVVVVVVVVVGEA